MEPRVSLITLGVSDLERSIAFYRDGLGLPQREGPAQHRLLRPARRSLALPLPARGSGGGRHGSG